MRPGWLILLVLLGTFASVTAQPSLVIHPDVLYYTNAGPNDLNLINSSTESVTVDSMGFSRSLNYGYGVDLELDQVYSIYYLMGSMYGDDRFPDFAIPPGDSVRLTLYWDSCPVCAGKTPGGGPVDTLFVSLATVSDTTYTSLIDFTYYVGAEEQPGEAPLRLAAYPNPFAGTTNVTYDLPAPSQVRMSVFDLLGREVLRVSDGLQAAGRHEVTIIGSGLRSGVYVLQVDAGESRQSRTIVLLR